MSRGSGRGVSARSPEPRRVLHLIDTGGPGGAETIFLELLRRLDPSRWASVGAVPYRDWLAGAMEEHGLEPVVLPSRGSFDFRYLAAIVRLVRKCRADLIQTHLLGSAVYGTLAGRLTGVPVVCTFHGPADIGAAERFGRPKLRIVSRWAARTVFVSDSLRAHFEGLAPFREGSAAVVPNGIDVESFAAPRDGAFRAELGIAPDAVLIGALGNIRPSKAYPVLLRAAAALRARSSELRFVIVGETRGGPFDELLRLRAELGLAEVVTFAGFREDVPRVLASLDLFVVSSSHEGFSLSTVQALAARLPVVATRCGGPEEILEHGVTGILVERDDPEALAAGIERVALDRAGAAHLAEAGLAMVRRRFSAAAMIGRYEAIYEACLDGTRHPVSPRAATALASGSGTARQG